MKRHGKAIAFSALGLTVLGLALSGSKGAALGAFILGAAMLGVPLFALIGGVTILCFILWAGFDDLDQFSVLIERIRTLADNPTLLAIPLFIMSGAVMARGEISTRLIDFARALVGFIPGGLAVSGVLACMLFAAISGSSPATVVAIGGMMGPTLVKFGYQERFSHGLMTSAGSLGILIPPSIPMIIYPIVNQRAVIEVERLFAAGIGPGLVMGGILMGFSIFHGVKDGTERDPFDISRVFQTLRQGFWALMFPVLILGGIYSGLFNAVEAAAISVVYAVVIEVWVHGALKLPDIPKIFEETGIFLGALLVIMVAALSFSEFLEGQQIPEAAVEWIRSLELSPIAFLLILNLLLLIVGTLMDILSAMFVFVPLLAPIAMSLGVDPMHFGIIFIVNLEIGYLTPPVGLNLFVASTLFDRSLGHIIRSVAPFIGLMLFGVALVTYVPALSIGLGNWVMGDDERGATTDSPTPLTGDPDESPPPGGVQTMEDMMREAEGGGGGGGGRVLSMEEMMQELEGGDDVEPEGANEGEEERPEAIELPPGRTMTMEEMMEAAGIE